MKTKTTTTLFICFLCAVTGFAQDINLKKLDSLFDALSANNKAMGTFAVAKAGKVIYQRSLGFSNIENGRQIPANSQTKYRIGSTTKMFTAAMVYQLIDEGRLSAETKLSKYYPQLPNADKITIMMLLDHTNGLFDFVNDGEDPAWITVPHTKQEILERVKNTPNFDPGARKKYSNTGYLLAAYIIEDVTHKTYAENLKKRICNKLSLKSTYSPATNELKANEAASFLAATVYEPITDIYFPNVVGVGDILSTATDLIIFNEALLSGKLFSMQGINAIHSFTDQSVFGAGIHKIPFYNKMGYGHGGDTFGTHSLVATFNEDKFTIVYCINGEVFPHNDVAIGMLSIIYGRDYKIPSFKVIEVPQDILQAYTGTYSGGALPLKIMITTSNNVLIAQATGQSSFPLEATATNIFKFDQSGIVIEFNDKQELVLKQGGGVYTMKKEL